VQARKQIDDQSADRMSDEKVRRWQSNFAEQCPQRVDHGSAILSFGWRAASPDARPVVREHCGQMGQPIEYAQPSFNWSSGAVHEYDGW
jgi:hypothetical protein